MNETQPIWYLLAVSIIGSLPATLTAVAGIIYAISRMRSGQEKIEAKVDGVRAEVDGKHTQLLNVIQNLASPALQRAGRVGDPSHAEPAKVEIITENITVENKGNDLK